LTGKQFVALQMIKKALC